MLYLQNTADLSDLVSSGRDRKPEELAFSEECELKSLSFRAERFVFYDFFILLILGHAFYLVYCYSCNYLKVYTYVLLNVEIDLQCHYISSFLFVRRQCLATHQGVA
jgi:hypothetical protein